MPRRDRPQDQETLLLLLLALIAPPISVFMMRGCGHEVVICVVLGLLFLFPGHIYAYYLVAEHLRKKKTGQVVVVETPAQPTKSNVVQVTSSAPPPVVQAIEYKPQSAAPPPPTPVSPTPAAPAPTPTPAPAPTVTEQVVVVTKSPDKAPEKAPEAPPVVPPAAAPK
ncbi:hypothetical protein KCU93_g4718, partial [Aureobasidium melanogenum]